MMIRKRNVGLLVIGLSAAGFALAQMGISNEGVTFPDGSVQTTASGTEYRIIGVTSVSTNGAPTATDGDGAEVDSIVALNQMCENEFGAGVRAAFSNEQLAPFITPSTITATAWVRPTGVRVVHDPDLTGDDWVALDGFSGVAGVADTSDAPAIAWRQLSCANFYSASNADGGLIRDPQGGILARRCNSSYRVACSARVQIPVYQPTQ